MSIQRYSIGHYDAACGVRLEIDTEGDCVLYTDHLTDKQAALDAQQAAHAAEVERLTAARDAAVRERDAAVEVIRRSLLINDTPHEDARYYRIIRILRAALSKIGGGRNGNVQT